MSASYSILNKKENKLVILEEMTDSRKMVGNIYKMRMWYPIEPECKEALIKTQNTHTHIHTHI
jgi:hypothetical protein